MERTLPYCEYVEWCAYLEWKTNRTEKIELYLARICLVLAQVNGNKNAKLKDFLFVPPENENGMSLKAKMKAWVMSTNRALKQKEKANVSGNSVGQHNRKHKRTKVVAGTGDR